MFTGACTATWQATFTAVPCRGRHCCLPHRLAPKRSRGKNVRLFRKCPGSTIRCVTAATQAGALIGRGSELARLADLIRAAATGRGSAVLIEGEPGIGKSSLVRAALAEAVAGRCAVFWGSGDELGQALPLLPLLEAL